MLCSTTCTKRSTRFGLSTTCPTKGCWSRCSALSLIWWWKHSRMINNVDLKSNLFRLWRHLLFHYWLSYHGDGVCCCCCCSCLQLLGVHRDCLRWRLYWLYWLHWLYWLLLVCSVFGSLIRPEMSRSVKFAHELPHDLSMMSMVDYELWSFEGLDV